MDKLDKPNMVHITLISLCSDGYHDNTEADIFTMTRCFSSVLSDRKEVTERKSVSFLLFSPIMEIVIWNAKSQSHDSMALK